MHAGLLPLMALRLTAVLVLAKIIQFSFGRGTPRPNRSAEYGLELAMRNACFCTSFFARVKPIIYEKPNLVLWLYQYLFMVLFRSFTDSNYVNVNKIKFP
jgi:hypothetical protein